MAFNFPRQRASVVLRELGAESMLYDPDGDKVVRLNATARRIWDLCDGDRDIPAIAAAIQNEFAVGSEADVGRDVAKAVAGFAAAGLLTDEV
jgi:hypothetical protein